MVPVNRDDALRIIGAMSEALRQPHVNLQIAKAYLFGSDERIRTRTWENVFDAIIGNHTGAKGAIVSGEERGAFHLHFEKTPD
jgi:hypothetical protein